MTKDEFITHLIEKNSFRKLGPITLLYEDKHNIIIVYATDKFVMIVTDGLEVTPYQNIEGITTEPKFWDEMLQKVLNKF